MIKSELIKQLKSLIDDRKSFLDEKWQGDDITLADITALTEAIEIISTAIRHLMLSGLCRRLSVTPCAGLAQMSRP